MSIPSQRSDLVDVALWRRWRTSRRGCETWARWTERDSALGHWSIDELARPRWSPEVDRMQAALVALTQRGEGWAVATLLVQLRPGLGRLVGRRVRQRREPPAAAADEVRSAFFETVCRHPLDRRPQRIAANLVLDTRQRLDRADRPIAARAAWVAADGPGATAAPVGGARGRAPAGRPHEPIAGLGPSRPDPTADPSGRVGTVLALRRSVDRLAGTDRSRALTAEAAYRAWVLDRPQAEIAADLGVERAALRQRLHRLRDALRHDEETAA